MRTRPDTVSSQRYPGVVICAQSIPIVKSQDLANVGGTRQDYGNLTS